ncbi:MAG: TerC family protein [Oligoflexia bacterium]|nr:TerC family protein [Oligoflexia bacterium]
MHEIVFPFSEYWWFFAAFTALVLVLISIDLGVFHRRAHEVSFREASLWCAIWVALALLFNFGLYEFALWRFSSDPAFAGLDATANARQLALEFLTGYLVEQSLSVDNIFIFIVVFEYFRIPRRYQHRVLFFGILGALIFRAIFIALGAVLMKFYIVNFIFGALLILTGIKMLYSQQGQIEPEKNPVIKMLRRFFPVTPELHGQSFVLRENGRLTITPLLIALIFMEITDIVFALDSVPAIFAITREPLIVFTSNIFAILGLRSLYFMLEGAMQKFHALRYGLSAILVFVGLKMIWLDEHFGGKFPIHWSLAIIGGCLAASVVGSLLIAPPKRRS